MMWRCPECGEEFDDVDEFFDVECIRDEGACLECEGYQ